MLKRSSPGCSCCGACDSCTAIDDYILEDDWTEESGVWTFYTGLAVTDNYATVSDDNAAIVRTNATSEYRKCLTRFSYLSGTKADTTVYLSMRDADGDGFRVEVAVVKTTGTFTVNVYRTESGSDTLVDGPSTFTSGDLPNDGSDGDIVIVYDPDYDIIQWGVAGATQQRVLRAYGTVACDLALRDVIVGTKAINSQVIAFGTWINGNIPGFNHSLCACDTGQLKHAPNEFTVTIDGLAATSTQMISGVHSTGYTCRWLAEWAPQVNASYSVAGASCGWSYNYLYNVVLIDTTVDIDIYVSGVYQSTASNVPHKLSVMIVVTAGCQNNETTLSAGLYLYDYNPADPGFPPYPWVDIWYWNDTYYAPPLNSNTVLFSKTYSGAKDLRTLVDEELTLVAGTGSDYLDWSSATLKLTSVVS